ncbi:magnesium transporter CorA family protein [Sulfurimonas sp.]|uniref:magnesium transporter CorA family protein n=1 Tax=Sulfurimonas sp. TaxID=2022749 RepID=UPI003565E996
MENILTQIDALHLEDLKNDQHPSIFDDNEGYNILIVRLPVIANENGAKSLGFVFGEQNSYFYDRSKNEFKEFDNTFDSPYSIIDKAVDRVLKSFIKYQESISDMEEDLYANKTNKDFLNSWLEIKLEILRIERMLTRTTNTMDEFIDFYENQENFPINKYMDIHEHLERTMRSATLQLSKLDYLYSFYNAKSNDKMNRMIYVLTIISAIFLPLNLVVGFFGMNTSGLPLASGENGTYYAISVMLSLALGASVVFRFWRRKVEK